MNKSNKNIAFKGSKLTVSGRELREGDPLPKFKLTGLDMKDVDSSAFAGKKLIISVVPSLDTPVCSEQTKHFSREISGLGSDVAVLTVSMDLPFAQKRWCGAEGVDKVVVASDHKYRGFGEDFGVYIQEWGVLARAVFVADRKGRVVHTEYVSEISSEPDYASAIAAAKKAA